jgi:hypothetical protein
MSPLNHSPASIRYLKARLRILKRPAVWGSTAVLLLTLLSVYTLLQRPEWLTVNESDRTPPVSDSEATPDVAPNALPPEEDSAIGIDIDNLSVLRSEISNFDDTAELDLLDPSIRTATSGDDSDAAASTPVQAGSPLFGSSAQPSQPSQSSSTYAQADTPLSLNLFNTPSLLQGGSAAADPSAGGSSGIGVGASQTQPAQSTSPLRSAVEQYANSSSQANSSAQDPSSEAASDDQRRRPAMNPGLLPTQPLGQYAPQTSPAPGTTGYTIPPSLIYGPNSSYANPASAQPVQGLPQAPQVVPQAIPIQPGIGQTSIQTPYGSGTGNLVPSPSVQPQVVQPPPQPFSVPRSSAGYSIRGRDIETFSNP